MPVVLVCECVCVGVCGLVCLQAFVLAYWCLWCERVPVFVWQAISACVGVSWRGPDSLVFVCCLFVGCLFACLFVGCLLVACWLFGWVVRLVLVVLFL